MKRGCTISAGRAARILGLSRHAVLRLIVSGKLKAWVVGSRGAYQISFASVIDRANKLGAAREEADLRSRKMEPK